MIVPNLDLPAICSPKFKPGPPAEEAQVLSERLNEVLLAYVSSLSTSSFPHAIVHDTHRSGILPLSSLCIHPAKSAWVLYVDAICINYDGNAFDAALIAMVAALKNSTYHPLLPVLAFTSSFQHTSQKPRTTPKQGVRYARARSKSPCKSNAPPYPCLSAYSTRTCIFLPLSPLHSYVGPADPNLDTQTRTHTLADPTAFEEPLLDTTLSVVLDSTSGDLISVSQAGLGSSADTGSGEEGEDTLLACISAAKKRRAELVLGKIYA